MSPRNSSGESLVRFGTLRAAIHNLRLLRSKLKEARMAQVDGLSESQYLEMTNSKKRKGGDIAAIFVHAGAGFHSHQNENVHLEACARASKAGMAFLKAGGTAVDAVEAAVRILEDNEITNAGYGSNLAIDGTVECDATIVDHHGRSGAVGALSQISHPVHVARLILEGSTHRLSLRRVPPNLLVGQGALDFAFDHEVPIMHPDFLVTPAARQRWKRWMKDLEEAQEKAIEELAHVSTSRNSDHLVLQNNAGFETPARSEKRLAPLVNESQPYSPNLSPAPENQSSRDNSNPLLKYTSDAPQKMRPLGHDYCAVGSCNRGTPGLCPANVVYPLMQRNGTRQDGQTEIVAPSPASSKSTDLNPQRVGVPSGPGLYAQPQISSSNLSQDRSTDGITSGSMWSDSESSSNYSEDKSQDHLGADDLITDTVGAIAIDAFGNIAAASSSGGIGMKHRGRTGPAALVGIGTAVHPVHSGDKSKTCVAVVTSGTGEHMATTMAANTCADRLYWGTRTDSKGEIVSTDDETAIQSFVNEDFMGHPSVKHSNTSAAIGVLAAKRTTDGVWFYFAHNTESFALCSMTSEDNEPQVVMSRMPSKTSRLNTGGRSCTWRPRSNIGDFKSPKRRRTKLSTSNKD